MKKNYQKISISLGLFLISLFAFPDITKAVDIEASASRTSGVAPLSVHFNADLTASSPIERSFHNLEYSWDFGDPSAGNWGTDNKPKNQDKGPVSAHVYETPGSFTATLTVRNASGIINTKTFQISVTDPDIVFAGTKTTCISTNSDFAACPIGATHIVSSDLSAISDYTDAGERVLLSRGNSWTINSNINFPENTGPTLIGAYGACTSPDTQGICANAPVITVTGDNQFIDMSNKRDWRVADLAISGAKTVPWAIFAVINVKDDLIYRIKTTGFATPVEWTHWRSDDTDYFDNNALVSSRITNTGVNVVYMGGDRFSIMGNILQDADQSHILRVWQAYASTISHNIISGSSLTTADGRDALKLHGQVPSDIGTYAQTGAGGLRNNTEFVVVADNIFGTSGPWPVSAGPQNDELDERTSDIIFEKNRFLSDYGNVSVHRVQISLMFEGRYYTVRNNIFDGTGSANGYTGVYVARRGVEWTPLGNNVYNNTIYSQSNYDNQAVGVEVHVDADSTIVRNNLVSFPNTSLKSDVVNNAGLETTISNNVLTDTPYLFNSNNLNPLLRNFSLTSNSTQVINQGTTVPVFDDFSGQSRIGTYDIGAYEYISGGDTIAPSAPTGVRAL